MSRERAEKAAALVLQKEFPGLRLVTTWDNGIVTVEDRAGNEVPVLQGPVVEVGDLVLAACDNGTRFQVGVFQWGYLPSSRSAFFAASRPHLKPCAKCGHDPVDRSVF